MQYYNSNYTLSIIVGDDITLKYYNGGNEIGEALIFTPKETFRVRNESNSDVISLLLNMGDGKYIFINDEIRSFEFEGEIDNFDGYFVGEACYCSFKDNDYVYLLSEDKIAKIPNKILLEGELPYEYYYFHNDPKYEVIPHVTIKTQGENILEWTRFYGKIVDKKERRKNPFTLRRKRMGIVDTN